MVEENPLETKVSDAEDEKLENCKGEKKETTIPPKPIIVLEISDVTEFTKLIKGKCDCNFMVDIAGG